MASRLKLVNDLANILGENYKDNVYFQPPASVTINYPAIIVELENIKNKSADNIVYLQQYYYKITFVYNSIGTDASGFSSDAVISALSKLNNARHDRHYINDNMYHDSFTILY